MEFALGATLARFTEGTLPVFAAGDRYVIKLFPSDAHSHFDAETTALQRIDGSLSIPTPRVIAAGLRGEWHFVVMTRLAGQSLATVWHSIPRDARVELARNVGAALAELHSVPVHDCAPLAIDWPQFLRAQRESCVARQAAKGLPAHWLDQLDDFLQRWFPEDDGRRVLLHTEVMREHLLVENDGDAWRLSGLVDFEPSMIGAPDYELASVGLFVTCAEPGLLRATLDAYGMKQDADQAPRFMAYALLHRYSNLRWYLERLPSDPRSATIESLAQRWFAA